jgi:hypothetical protein
MVPCTNMYLYRVCRIYLVLRMINEWRSSWKRWLFGLNVYAKRYTHASMNSLSNSTDPIYHSTFTTASESSKVSHPSFLNASAFTFCVISQMSLRAGSASLDGLPRQLEKKLLLCPRTEASDTQQDTIGESNPSLIGSLSNSSEAREESLCHYGVWTTL